MLPSVPTLPTAEATARVAHRPAEQLQRIVGQPTRYALQNPQPAPDILDGKSRGNLYLAELLHFLSYPTNIP